MVDFAALTAKIETAIDAHAELTRERRGARGVEIAELVFSNGGWTARCDCRSKVARGRGSQLMYTLAGHGETPEAAVDDLIQMIPIQAEVLKS